MLGQDERIRALQINPNKILNFLSHWKAQHKQSRVKSVSSQHDTLTFVDTLTSTRSVLSWECYVPGLFCGSVLPTLAAFVFCTLAWMLWKGDASLTRKLIIFSKPHPLSPSVGWLALVCMRVSSSLTEGAGAVMTTAQMNVWTILLLFILQAFCLLWKKSDFKVTDERLSTSN